MTALWVSLLGCGQGGGRRTRDNHKHNFKFNYLYAGGSERRKQGKHRNLSGSSALIHRDDVALGRSFLSSVPQLWMMLWMQLVVRKGFAEPTDYIVGLRVLKLGR